MPDQTHPPTRSRWAALEELVKRSKTAAQSLGGYLRSRAVPDLRVKTLGYQPSTLPLTGYDWVDGGESTRKLTATISTALDHLVGLSGADLPTTLHKVVDVVSVLSRGRSAAIASRTSVQARNPGKQLKVRLGALCYMYNPSSKKLEVLAVSTQHSQVVLDNRESIGSWYDESVDIIKGRIHEMDLLTGSGWIFVGVRDVVIDYAEYSRRHLHRGGAPVKLPKCVPRNAVWDPKNVDATCFAGCLTTRRRRAPPARR